MADDKRMEYWNQRWEGGRIGWHIEDVNHSLLKNGEALLVPGYHHRVFVPLCGKSQDLKWFYDGGHSVVGVEGAEKAVIEFFSEHNLSCVTETLPWGKLFRTEDDRLRLYCCDLMAADPRALGKFDAVWDRGSLVAIYEEDQKRYVELMKSLLCPDFRYLLSTLVYTPTETFSGPPRNVPTALVEELYGDFCQVKVLGTVEDYIVSNNAIEVPKNCVIKFSEVSLLLTPRA